MLKNLKGKKVLVQMLGSKAKVLSDKYKIKPKGKPIKYVREEMYKNILDILREEEVPFRLVSSPRTGERFRKILNKNWKYLTYHTCDSRQDVWNLKTSHILGYFYFDKLGYSGWSEMARNPQLFLDSQKVSSYKANDFYERIYTEIVEENKSIYRQTNRDFQLPEDPYVFCVMQKPDDSVAQHSRIDTLSLTQHLINEFRGGEVKLVVKQHPSDKCGLRRRWLAEVNNTYRNIIVTKASIHDIIPNALAVVSTNSGVGFESLLHMKPVFTAGKTDYEWVTNNLNKPEDLKNIVKLAERGVNEVCVKKFLYYFLNNYLIKSDDIEGIRRKLASI